MADDRCVRRLRLSASDEAGARRGLRLIDDALRCASLPEARSRIVLVRKLALGVLPAELSSQSLALRIERAWADRSGRFVHGAAAAAGSADVVWFADALDSHCALALRLAAGTAPADWYWPLAVAGYDAARGPRDSLRRTLLSLASDVTARVALPACAAAIAAAGRLQQLAEAVEAGDVAWLRAQAGLPAARADAPSVSARAAEATPLGTSAAGSGGLNSGATRDSTQPEPPFGVEIAPSHADSAGVDSRVRQFLIDALAAAHRPAATRRQGDPAGQQHEARPSPVPATIGAAVTARSPPRSEPPKRHAASTDAKRAELFGRPERAPTEALHTAGADAEIEVEAAAANRTLAKGIPTSAGGLLFLVAVLQRVGFPEWAEQQPSDRSPAIVVGRLFALLLARLDVVPEDPAWLLGDVGDSKPFPKDPGNAVDDPPGADPLDTCAEAWLSRCRRGLRTKAGIGPATLVCRRAALSVGTTHVDVFFDLADADLHVRRAGLDIDPGWVPWLGRVVAFHYDARGERRSVSTTPLGPAGSEATGSNK